MKFAYLVNRVFRRAINNFRRRVVGVDKGGGKPTDYKGERILMFGWELPPFNSGGLGVACFELARTLSSFGVPITFVLPRAQAIKAPFLKLLFAGKGDFKVKGVKTSLYPYIHSPRKGAGLNSDKYFDRELLREVQRYGKSARKIAKEEEFEIIHAHDWLSFPAGAEAKKVSGKPLIVHVHATEFDRCGGEHVDPEVFEIEKAGLTCADKIIAVSELTKRTLVRHYGVSAKKIEVAHNGVSSASSSRLTEDIFAPLKKAGYKVVLFLGRITLQKGPDYFLKAAQKVLKINPKTIFVVGGTGDMERQIIAESARLGIADKVLFTGYVKSEAVGQIYRSADLYVMPSVSEPFGIVALEALSNKTPVIISKQSGVSETVDHALKVDFWDTDEMANKIHAVISNKSLSRCLREHGKIEAQKNSWHKTAKKCVNVYKSVLAGKAS